jgi:hypothetical protein
MSTRFEIDPVLGADWKETMERREFLLAPLLRYLRHGVVRLSVEEGAPGNSQPVRYRCEFTGEDIDGDTYAFASSNTDGVMAIDDTVARLRRTLTRRHQNRVPQTTLSAG